MSSLLLPFIVDTLASLRQLALSSQQSLSPAFIRSLIREKGVSRPLIFHTHGQDIDPPLVMIHYFSQERLYIRSSLH